ncbi:NUDIX hydrolase [Mucilaginibacter pallidiroseus]|uniref:NUDIX hydrolase n=1 Tax=Mucilaginibacter pallidiroseus TaxID=2599295 RepID=A0A563UIA0_9SPHI|nr:NUDIX domain-containing protein [Mucilaginibacter pallidiroseus]TWR31023.1 NUDIX hydrolase [Mucilaginibacter pallidiroseus]
MKAFKTANESDARGNGFIPNLAIDVVVFGFHDSQLKVLLVKYSKTDYVALPGGFIKVDENLHDAAERVAKERTGLNNIFLDQFFVFGDMSRYNAQPFREVMEANGMPAKADHWLLNRFISVGYFALVDFTKVTPTPDKLFDSCGWYDLNALPALIQDHAEIISKALNALRDRLDDKLIGFNLLPEEFTMGQLQALYETILGKKLLRSAFQRKMLGLNILERLAKKYTGAANKAPYLYRFKAK